MNIVLPACLIRKLVHYIFFNQLFNGFIKTKQNKKEQKTKKTKNKKPTKKQKKKVLQNCRSTKAGFIEDHELCTNWVQDLFSQAESCVSETNLPQSTSISLPLHALYIFDVHTLTCVYQIYVRACVCACVRVCTRRRSCRRFASSCRRTENFKLGMEVKTLFVCFGVLLTFFLFFFDLFLLS